ncbi:hypothetical protein ABZ593_05520 [Streptomyces sp. NPDC012617]|uniref:hypothetical protein n=1 Tax=Streptomyces TaxID=1883 RepID=UPI0033DDDB5A
MTSTMEWIRRHYGVPARHRMRITYDGKPAMIVGAGNAGLRLRVDGERRIIPTHPCWRIVYPPVPEPARPRGWCAHCGKDRAMTKNGVMGPHRFRGTTWNTDCPGVGKPPTHRVINQTHPGEQKDTK